MEIKPKGWNNVDEKCLHCNSITRKATGINKQNIKRLFAKPTIQDIMIFDNILKGRSLLEALF